MTVDTPRLEDRLGPLEPPYRSHGEAKVGRLLDHYGIPFLYEMPVMVLDRGQYRLWHPDFTLPHYGWLVIECAGTPNGPDYAARIAHQRATYAANGIPAMFLYPDDLAGSEWAVRALEQLAAQGEDQLRRYRANSGTQYSRDPYRRWPQ